MMDWVSIAMKELSSLLDEAGIRFLRLADPAGRFGPLGLGSPVWFGAGCGEAELTAESPSFAQVISTEVI